MTETASHTEAQELHRIIGGILESSRGIGQYDTLQGYEEQLERALEIAAIHVSDTDTTARGIPAAYIPAQYDDGELIAHEACAIAHGDVEVMVQRSTVDGKMLVTIDGDPERIRVDVNDGTAWDGPGMEAATIAQLRSVNAERQQRIWKLEDQVRTLRRVSPLKDPMQIWGMFHREHRERMRLLLRNRVLAGKLLRRARTIGQLRQANRDLLAQITGGSNTLPG
jgi:hypothetical protein